MDEQKLRLEAASLLDDCVSIQIAFSDRKRPEDVGKYILNLSHEKRELLKHLKGEDTFNIFNSQMPRRLRHPVKKGY